MRVSMEADGPLEYKFHIEKSRKCVFQTLLGFPHTQGGSDLPFQCNEAGHIIVSQTFAAASPKHPQIFVLLNHLHSVL